MAFIDVLYCNSSVQFFRKDAFSLPFHAPVLHFDTMIAWISKAPFTSFRVNSAPPEIRINGVEECALASLHEGREWSEKSNGSSFKSSSSSLLALLRSDARSSYFRGGFISYRMAGSTWICSRNFMIFCDLSMMNAGKARLIPGHEEYYPRTGASSLPKYRFLWVQLSYLHLSPLFLTLPYLTKAFSCFSCPNQAWNEAFTTDTSCFQENNQWTISGCCSYSRVTVFKVYCQAGPDKALKSNPCWPSGLREAVTVSSKSTSEQHGCLPWSPDPVSVRSSCPTLLSSWEAAVSNISIMPPKGRSPAMSERTQKRKILEQKERSPTPYVNSVLSLVLEREHFRQGWT